MTHLTVNGHHYHIGISGSGVPILLLHGFTGDVSIWHDIRLALDNTYQVIAIDILGHGQSDKPSDISPYYMKNVARDMIQILDKLSVQQAHLLGYSMGGRLSLYLALHYPERFHSLILESASPGLATTQERDDRRTRDNALADKIEANGIEWFVDFWEKLSLWESQKSLSQDALSRQCTQRLQNDPQGLANSLRGMGTGRQPSLWDDLPSINLSTQLIVGEHDTKFIGINQEMAKLIPYTTMTPIANAGHTVHLENPVAFIDHLQSFLHHL
jgi:2-succinyl-6-hydroxy-2,4-cyclohexadiene-1-carboxylate synthase